MSTSNEDSLPSKLTSHRRGSEKKFEWKKIKFLMQMHEKETKNFLKVQCYSSKDCFLCQTQENSLHTIVVKLCQVQIGFD